MRRRLFALCLLLFLAPAGADAHPLAVPYARAVRAFNPRLPAAFALALADRVLVESDAAGIDARLVVALVAVESAWHPAARSTAGAQGLGQLMPATSAAWHVDAADPAANLRGTVLTIRSLSARYAALPPAERYPLVLAAYNAGPGAVSRYRGVPPFAETRRYVASVLALWRRLTLG